MVVVLCWSRCFMFFFNALLVCAMELLFSSRRCWMQHGLLWQNSNCFWRGVAMWKISYLEHRMHAFFLRVLIARKNMQCKKKCELCCKPKNLSTTPLWLIVSSGAFWLCTLFAMLKSSCMEHTGYMTMIIPALGWNLSKRISMRISNDKLQT